MSVELEDLNSFDKIELFMKSCEDILDPLGYIPFVSTAVVAGPRSALGLTQIVSSIVASPFLLIADIFSWHNRGMFYRTSKVFEHIVHGTANLVRGVFEGVPLVGNIFLIFYDNVLGFRMKYDLEGQRSLIFKEVTYLNPYLQRA